MKKFTNPRGVDAARMIGPSSRLKVQCVKSRVFPICGSEAVVYAQLSLTGFANER